MNWSTPLIAGITLVITSGCTHTNNSPLHASLSERDIDRVAPQVFPKAMPTIAALHMASGLMRSSEYGSATYFVDHIYEGNLWYYMSRVEEIAVKITRLEVGLFPAPTFSTFLGRSPDQLLAVDFENGLVSRLQHQADPRADDKGAWRTIPWEQGNP